MPQRTRQPLPTKERFANGLIDRRFAFLSFGKAVAMMPFRAQRAFSFSLPRKKLASAGIPVTLVADDS